MSRQTPVRSTYVSKAVLFGRVNLYPNRTCWKTHSLTASTPPPRRQVAEQVPRHGRQQVHLAVTAAQEERQYVRRQFSRRVLARVGGRLRLGVVGAAEDGVVRHPQPPRRCHHPGAAVAETIDECFDRPRDGRRGMDRRRVDPSRLHRRRVARGLLHDQPLRPVEATGDVRVDVEHQQHGGRQGPGQFELQVVPNAQGQRSAGGAHGL